MNKQIKLTLWSARTSVARGNFFQAERNVIEAEAQTWLEVFRKDEPNVLFVVSAKKPSKK